MSAEESAAQLNPKQLGQLNKELSTLQPVVDALSILAKQRQEVGHTSHYLKTVTLNMCPVEAWCTGFYFCSGGVFAWKDMHS